MIQKLNQFLADLSVLSKKVQNYHWNIVGRGFFSMHKELDKIYESLNDEVDEIAERILAINGRPLATLSSYIQISKIEEAKNEEIKIEDVIENLIKDFNYIISSAKEVKILADDNSDFGTSAMIDEFLMNSEKLLWMLNASK